ncbi:MAG TPA: hypothetical protein VL357_06750 [Rariglobus sp.]|jgi:hypothetical protein|nr:hypothetical protein [Rariglobus sp.]
MRLTTRRLAWWLALGAGGLDFCTGVGLAVVPAQVLPLMGVTVPGAEALIWLRWVGAFVWAVGVSYLLALVLGGDARLRTLLELTLPFRFSAGLFSAVAVAGGWLPFVWVSVPATDFALVVAQLWLLLRWRRRQPG